MSRSHDEIVDHILDKALKMYPQLQTKTGLANLEDAHKHVAKLYESAAVISRNETESEIASSVAKATSNSWMSDLVKQKLGLKGS